MCLGIPARITDVDTGRVLTDSVLLNPRPSAINYLFWYPRQSAQEKWMTEVTRDTTKRRLDSRGPRTVPPALRFAVFRRDSYTCQYCGRRAPAFPLHVDHVVAWACGGETVLANLRTACSECNLGKSSGSA